MKLQYLLRIYHDCGIFNFLDCQNSFTALDTGQDNMLVMDMVSINYVLPDWTY